jgi:hypothetical protein
MQKYSENYRNNGFDEILTTEGEKVKIVRNIAIVFVLIYSVSYFLNIQHKVDENKVASSLTPEEIAERRKIFEEQQEKMRLEKAREIAASILSTMKNEALDFTVRLDAKKKLEKDYPDFIKEHSADLRAFAALQKRTGVTIGMTQEDVLASSWGKPSRVNRSTYSFGVHEQWVYGGRNYLYFKNGILTSIQN